MSIHYFNEDVPLPKLKKRRTTDWIKSIIGAEEKKCGEISFIFCSDEYLLEVNKKYLFHDYYTDIITFDYVEGVLMSGDIFISVDRILENSRVFNTTFENELSRILAHGVLHLIGYKDKNVNDKKMMTFKEDYYLNQLNNK
jgi:probable rRNA maturation factor